MRIGDKVRFLNQTGGGIVVGFNKKGWATVQDEDGFEIPVPQSECVVVEENVVAKENASIQTRDGEKLNIALIYTKAREGYACTLANECNYSALVTYSKKYDSEYVTRYAGEILPYQKLELFKFDRNELNDGSKRVLVRIVPFKKGSGFNTSVKHTLKPVIEKDFILDPLNLLKDGLYKENEYISEKGYVIPMVNENIKELPLVESIECQDIKKVLKEKFEGETKSAAQQTKPQHRAFINGKWIDLPSNSNKRESLQDKALITVNAQGIMEVDLHASALLETTAGMDNTSILKYQLDKFNEAMLSALSKRGTRIVFIHGKGDGVLRKAILTELKNKYSGCKWQDASFKEYGYGATMVTT